MSTSTPNTSGGSNRSSSTPPSPFLNPQTRTLIFGFLILYMFILQARSFFSVSVVVENVWMIEQQQNNAPPVTTTTTDTSSFNKIQQQTQSTTTKSTGSTRNNSLNKKEKVLVQQEEEVALVVKEEEENNQEQEEVEEEVDQKEEEEEVEEDQDLIKEQQQGEKEQQKEEAIQGEQQQQQQVLLEFEDSGYTDEEEKQWTPILRKALVRPGEILPTPQTIQPTSPYAYAMMSWSCNPDPASSHPRSTPYAGYKGYLANMMVASRILRDRGSTADFVALIKMKYHSNYTRLPARDEQMLLKAGIKLAYLAKRPDGANFFVDQFNKFLLFNMTQYKRILYMDGDVMPVNSMDYLFELSDNSTGKAILKPNVVVAGKTEPANGGFFMITPSRQAFLDIIGIIKSHGPNAGRRPGFNETTGFGHTIVAPDKWETNADHFWGTKWRFHGSWTDQGLLYSFLKYNLGSMTQIMARRIQQFGPGPDGTTTVLERVWDNIKRRDLSPLYNHSIKTLPAVPIVPVTCYNIAKERGYNRCSPPYSDHAHYTGAKKPWKQPRPHNLYEKENPTEDYIVWWRTLDKLNQEGYDIAFNNNLVGKDEEKKEHEEEDNKLQEEVVDDKQKDGGKDVEVRPKKLSMESTVEKHEEKEDEQQDGKEEKDDDKKQEKQQVDDDQREQRVLLEFEDSGYTDEEERQWTPVLRKALVRPGEILPTPQAIQPTSSYAYAMMTWSCDPDPDSRRRRQYPDYKSYLANMMIANRILRDRGSRADFLALIKMKYDSNYTRLPPADEEMLTNAGIKVAYMAKRPDGANFFVNQFNKFLLFNMTQYKRILYMDGDVMPVNSLDYLFELSDGPDPILKENVVLAGKTEPAQGGFFMIKPNATAYEDIVRIIKALGPDAGRRPYFNETTGFGHTIVPPDKWETNSWGLSGTEWSFVSWGLSGTEWSFHGGWTDQGLLYSFLKYNLRSMTQIFSRRIQHFGPGPNGTATLEIGWDNIKRREISPFYNYSIKTLPSVPIVPYTCRNIAGERGYPSCSPPYSDHAHFTGKKKPWKQPRPKNLHAQKNSKSDNIAWWRTLDQLNQEGHNVTFNMMK